MFYKMRSTDLQFLIKKNPKHRILVGSSVLRLKSQSKLVALINSDSEIIQFWFNTVHYLKISEQRW